MEGTRRLLWWQAMAGGLGGWYGFYHLEQGSSFNGHPYPSPEQLRTHHAFWHERDRFRLDMGRANGLTDGRAIATPGEGRAVFYAEGADALSMDLSYFADPRSAVAVDTAWEYKKVDVGPLDPIDVTWEAPYETDWAIAVGGFDR